jgi:hypothetical protein
MGRSRADLDTHRYTRRDQTPKVFPRGSSLQTNSEKRFGSSVLSVGVSVQPFAFFLSTILRAVSKNATRLSDRLDVWLKGLRDGEAALN